MTAQARKPAKPAAVKIRRPRKGSKAEAILTLTATTPATATQIAHQVSSPKQYVYDVLERYGIEPNTLESFKNTRADTFAAIQAKIVESLSPDAIKAASVKDRTILLGTIYDKERLERGQATSRIEIDLSARLRSALSRSGGRQAIEAEVVETKSTTDRVAGLLTNDPPNE